MLGLLGTFLGIVLGVIVSTSSFDVTTKARLYLENRGYAVQGLQCATTDRNADTFITCTARVEGQLEPYRLECSTSHDFSCRAWDVNDLKIRWGD